MDCTIAFACIACIACVLAVCARISLRLDRLEDYGRHYEEIGELRCTAERRLQDLETWVEGQRRLHRDGHTSSAYRRGQ